MTVCFIQSIFLNPKFKKSPFYTGSKREQFHLTIISHQPVGTFCAPLYLLFNFISALTDFEGWRYVLWLKVAHAVRMGKQLSKCERNPREYSHTQNVTAMQNNPGAERLSACTLIEDTTLRANKNTRALLETTNCWNEDSNGCWKETNRSLPALCREAKTW